jgi:SPP1 gp7 family putative phage head morphogenesis protein
VKEIELKPIIEDPRDFEKLEKIILDLLREEIYLPLIKELKAPKKTLKNSMNDLASAIMYGLIEFSRGIFLGKFDAITSKELKRLGAKWDRKRKGWTISRALLPIEIRNAVSLSKSINEMKVQRVMDRLAQILPEVIAEKLKVERILDQSLSKLDAQFKQSVRNITLTPDISDQTRKRIADEWTNNMKIYIKNFTEAEIKKLREEIEKSVLAGERYDSMVSKIKKSYGVSENKAKFLARQESRLAKTKFEEARYGEVGVREYKWHAVNGSSKHPTRPCHKKLADLSAKGKTFRWDQPPNTAEPGEAPRYNNPGQDFNCRCTARPVVRF